MQFDVAIVGAGTAGTYAAYLLAKAGLNVCLIEIRSVDKIYKYTGDAIGTHHLEKLGIDIPSKVVDHKYEGAEVYNPDYTVKYYIPGKGISLNMIEWARWLISKAVNAGVTILDEHNAYAPIIEYSRVTGVKVRRINTNTRSDVKAKVIIDASGATGVIRTKLPSEWLISEPLKSEDASYAYREIIEVDYDIESPENIKIFMNLDVAPGGYWWLFPKGRNVMNIGLGIWGKLVVEKNYNPKRFYEKYILNTSWTRGRRLINAGGGIVPTRRPLKSMVASGILTIGDAGVTVNPIHGGGLGPSLLSAKIASEVILEAYEKRDFTIDTLWQFNIKYMRAYGVKQAKLDVLRVMLQTLTNKELDKGLKARILTENDILELSSKGVSSIDLNKKLKIALKLLKIPSLARKLSLAFKYMKIIGKLYDNYPRSFKDFDKWFIQVASKYNEYRLKLGLTPTIM